MFSLNVAILLATVSAAPPLAVPAPPGELRGQVLDPSGRPVPRFTVNGVAFDGPQGRFKILTPPVGEFRVVIRAQGYAPNVFHVQGGSGKRLEVPEIRLGTGEHVLGEVLDAETDMPVISARVALADPAKIDRLRFVRPERVAPVGVSGSGGWYEILHAPRGLLSLVVSAPGYLPEFVPVNTRQPLPPVRLHRGGAITGLVRNTAGKPVEGAHVLALSQQAGDGAEAVTDEKGGFVMRKLRPGRYLVAVRALGRTIDGGEAVVEDGAVSDLSVGVQSTTSIALIH